MRATFGDEQIAMPVINDPDSIEDFIEAIKIASTVPQLEAMIKANHIAKTGRTRVEKIRALLEFKAKVSEEDDE